MNRIFTFCSLVFISVGTLAQSTTYIGAEVAYSADFFHLTDPGGRLSRPDVSAALWGATLRQRLHRHFFFETGLYARAYKVGLAFDGLPSTQGTDRTGYLLPLRIGARLPLFKEAVAICPVTGLTFGIADEGYDNWSEGTHDWQGPDPIQYRYAVQHSSQVFSLFQAGLGIDIRLGRKTLLGLSTSYYGGLNKQMTQHIDYTPNNGIASKGTQSSRGGFYSVGIGFRYAVDWWK